MFKSDQIAVGYESKYNYMLRTESISNSSFSPSKLIYPEVTDATCDEIVKKYPDLSDAAIARRVHSRFGVLNLMINANEQGYLEEKKKFKNFIVAHKKQILNDRHVGKNEKVAVRIISLSYSLYCTVWRFVRKGAVWSAGID